MKRWFSLFILVSTALSCVYPYDLPDVSGGKEYLVVDGSIEVGNQASLSVRYMEGVDGLPVVERWWVEDDTGVRYTADTGSSTVDMSGADKDKAYRMVMQVNGNTYSSSFEQVTDPPQLQEISFDKLANNVFCNVSLKDNNAGTGFVALSYEEIWNFHTDLIDFYLVDTNYWIVVERDEPDMSRYWCWHHTRSADEVLIDLTHLDGSVQYFPLMNFPCVNNRNHGDYTIKVKARSISEAEYRFRKNLANSSVGGYNLFTPNPGEIAGNVRCEEDPSAQVMGYVTLSYASTLTGKLDGRYYIAPSFNRSQFVIPAPGDLPILYYYWNYRPVYSTFGEDGETLYLWGHLRCIDCIADGGTLEKPDFQ